MRLLILMIGTLLAATAFADSDFKVNRLEVSAAAVETTDETTEAKEETEASQTKAQDYNSSRSNTTTAIDTDDDGDSVPTEDECTDAVDNDCTGTTDDAEQKKALSRK